MTGWFGVVAGGVRSHEQVGVGCGVVEDPCLVAEAFDGHVEETAGLGQPFAGAGCLVECEQPFGEVAVIVGQAGGAADDAAQRDPTKLIVDPVPVQEVTSGRGCRVDEVSPVQQCPDIGQGRDRQAVPRGDDLGVSERLRAAAPCRQQARSHVVPPPLIGIRGGIGPSLQGGQPMLERALRRHRQLRGGSPTVRLSEHLHQLGGRPGIGQPFDALGVGVQGGREGTLLGAEVAQDRSARLLGDRTTQRYAGRAPPVHISPRQQGVVVEHLLEVRDHPAGVHGIPVEATPDLVVHPPASHRLEGGRCHLQGCRAPSPPVVAQEELQHHRGRELRCPTEAAVAPVETGTQPDHRGVQGAGHDGRGRQGRHGSGHGGDQPGGGRVDLVAATRPRVGSDPQQIQQRVARQVGAAPERLAGRREQHGHRPAAAAGQGSGGCHVDGVDVGSFLTVDLDRDKSRLQGCRHRLVLEGLVRHDVAPVAGGVADRQEDRPVESAGQRERFRSPFPPVHRVVGMLSQVGALGLGQTVAHRVAFRVTGSSRGTSACSARMPWRRPATRRQRAAAGEARPTRRGARTRGPAWRRPRRPGRSGPRCGHWRHR